MYCSLVWEGKENCLFTPSHVSYKTGCMQIEKCESKSDCKPCWIYGRPVIQRPIFANNQFDHHLWMLSMYINSQGISSIHKHCKYSLSPAEIFHPVGKSLWLINNCCLFYKEFAVFAPNPQGQQAQREKLKWISEVFSISGGQLFQYLLFWLQILLIYGSPYW